jgi:cyclomaltodextrinase
MGRQSFALQDVLTNGAKSAYADWFEVTDWGPPVKYKSWDGGGAMPVFRKDAGKGFASDSAKKYIFDITRRWMDPNGDGDPSDGVDGWRLDVAQDVPRAFWVAWRKHVKSIHPDAYITGEIWETAAASLQGDQWDATMNYPFVFRATRFFIDQKRKITASELDRQLRELLATYPMPVNLVMQNLYDSHDTDRLVNMIANPDRDYDRCNRPHDPCPYDGRKPGSEAYRVLKLMATFQMTFLGAPMIYYGTEAGMFGADDPTDRKPMLWKDLEPYDNPQDFVMDDVLEHYRRLIAIRNRYPALRTGTYQAVLTDDANDLFAFRRTLGTESVIVVINNSRKNQSVEIPVPFADGARVVDLLTAPVQFYDASMDKLGFPGFRKGATVRAIQIHSNAAALPVQKEKLRLRLASKSAAVLVRP